MYIVKKYTYTPWALWTLIQRQNFTIKHENNLDARAKLSKLKTQMSAYWTNLCQIDHILYIFIVPGNKHH